MKRIVLLLIAFALQACNNLLDADLAERNTFIKLFNGTSGIEAADCLAESDGYIILGNMISAIDDVTTVVIKTDLRGNRIGDVHYFEGGSGNSIVALPNEGYFIVGDKVELQQGSQGVITTYSTRMIQLSSSLDLTSSFEIKDGSSNLIRTSYRGTSVTVTKDKLVILGTYQSSPGAPIKPYIQVRSTSNLQVDWFQQFELIDRSYRNSKSVHYNNGKIIWASAIAQEQTNFDKSYVSIPYVEQGSIFSNYSLLGEITDQSFRPNDIQPAIDPLFGYGVVGTIANTNGTMSNLFFLRTDQNGTIIPSSIKYFDTFISSRSEEFCSTTPCPINEVLSTSEIQDFGTSITSTKNNGFVIAGHYSTTNESDNIVLIRLDYFGNMVWIKTIGGIGSEHVSRVHEVDDGKSILLCGTNTVGGVPSIFLIKTDKNGELKN